VVAPFLLITPKASGIVVRPPTAFGGSRLCDIGTLELQQFVLQKMAGGLGWQCADHYRNLMSKIFVIAKKWGFFAGDNPAIGVELPEKKAVREKHTLLPDQIPTLLANLEEPARTMVLVGVLTRPNVSNGRLDCSTLAVEISPFHHRVEVLIVAEFHLVSAATSQQQTSSDEGEDAHNRAGGHACQKSRVVNILVRCIHKITVQ
jgi:hypothetical protein